MSQPLPVNEATMRVAYEQGYAFAFGDASNARKEVVQFRGGANPNTLAFARYDGISDALAGKPSRYSGVAAAKQLPIPEASKRLAYDDGFTAAVRDPAAARAWAKDNRGTDPETYNFARADGIIDALAGQPNRYTGVVPTGQVPNSGVPVVGSGRTRPAPPYTGPTAGSVPVPAPNSGFGYPYFPRDTAKYYELSSKVFGKLVPYDVAVSLERLPSGGLLDVIKAVGVDFQILGDDPGEQREGYRLSGPNGRIAAQVRRDIAAGDVDPFPQHYGLSGWVMARLKNGRLKYIGRAELERLGLL